VVGAHVTVTTLVATAQAEAYAGLAIGAAQAQVPATLAQALALAPYMEVPAEIAAAVAPASVSALAPTVGVVSTSVGGGVVIAGNLPRQVTLVATEHHPVTVSVEGGQTISNVLVTDPHRVSITTVVPSEFGESRAEVAGTYPPEP
jgi:hypothetical protein